MNDRCKCDVHAVRAARQFLFLIPKQSVCVGGRSQVMSRALRVFSSLKFGVLISATLAGVAVADEPTLPDGPGKAQVMQACSTCHALTQVTSQARSVAQWADTVEQMIARGAPVSDEDYPVIVKYLGKYFAPARQPTASLALPPTLTWTRPQVIRQGAAD